MCLDFIIEVWKKTPQLYYASSYWFKSDLVRQNVFSMIASPWFLTRHFWNHDWILFNWFMYSCAYKKPELQYLWQGWPLCSLYLFSRTISYAKHYRKSAEQLYLQDLYPLDEFIPLQHAVYGNQIDDWGSTFCARNLYLIDMMRRRRNYFLAPQFLSQFPFVRKMAQFLFGIQYFSESAWRIFPNTK